MAFWSALVARPAPIPAHARTSPTLFFCLIGAFVLTLVPHAAQLPLWLTVSILIALAIRVVMEVRRLPLPSTVFSSLLALCLMAGVLLQYNNLAGREAGTAFMAGLLAIKFFELRGARDIAVIIFSNFFVVMSALLYSQALELFIYCLIMMWVLTALLVRLQTGDQPQDQLTRMLSRAGIVFLQALPLTIFLFFFFPRFAGKLQMNLGDASRGLTDTVHPGSIAQLSKDDSIAMYVKFGQGDVPAVESMYWRAMVLWKYQDGVWTRGPLAEVPVNPMPAASSGSVLVDQEITIWPHNQRWLFALDVPIRQPVRTTDPAGWAMSLEGSILQLADYHQRVDHRERYNVVSAEQLAPREIQPNEADGGVRLPEDEIAPEVRSLADRLHRENPEPRAYALSVLAYFQHNHFKYTSTPEPVEGGAWLSKFLFETKSGFCEHYASAFAVLMRLEHIPARLVIGYQGAEYNPYNGDYIVRQSNAHAWDEVWISSKKAWVRFDPTALLPPESLGPLGSSTPNSAEGESLALQVASHRLQLNGSGLPGWLHRTTVEFQLRRQQLEASWDDLIFSYNNEMQSKLAQALGFGPDSAFKLGLACVVITGLFVLLFQRFMKPRVQVPPVEKFYAAFCRQMARSGVPRALWEGPLEYTGRLAEAFPEQKEAIREVGRIVANARYAASPASPSPRELESLLTFISPAASSPRERTHAV